MVRAGHEHRLGLVQRPMEVCLRREPAAQPLALSADRDAGRPKRPGIEDEIIEDEAIAIAGLHTEFCRSGPHRWHIGDLDFFFHAQQISRDIRSRAAINSRLCSMVSGDACSASFGSPRMEAAIRA